MHLPNPLGAGGSKLTKSYKKKQVLDEDVMNIMVDKVGDLSNTIREIYFHWTDKLFKCVYEHLGYDDTVMDTALSRLFEYEMATRFFISKPAFAQKKNFG